MAQAATLPLSVLDRSLSTLGQYTDYPDGVSPHLPSVAAITCADVQM